MKTRGFFKRAFTWLLHHKGLLLCFAFLLGLTPFVTWKKAPSPLPVAIHTAPAAEEEPLPPAEAPAAPAVPAAARPQITIVIDDMGLDAKLSRRAIALDAALTLSFLPYTHGVQALVDSAKEKGHEIMLHMPMQAEGGAYPGPRTLRPDLSEEELRRRIAGNLDAFHGYDSVNNHMGSAFTADEDAMRLFMEEIRARGLIFLDSRTTAATQGERLAQEMGVPAFRRHIFLDHIETREAIAHEVTRLMAHARQHGHAIAIGHPHRITLDVLEEFLPVIKRDFDLVLLNAFARDTHKNER